MPRKPNCVNKNTYHFEVTYNDDFEGVKSKYFRTCVDIEETFQISRATIYNYYMGIVKEKKHKTILDIKKLNPPIQRYKKIIVDFD